MPWCGSNVRGQFTQTQKINVIWLVNSEGLTKNVFFYFRKLTPTLVFCFLNFQMVFNLLLYFFSTEGWTKYDRFLNSDRKTFFFWKRTHSRIYFPFILFYYFLAFFVKILFAQALAPLTLVSELKESKGPKFLTMEYTKKRE